MVLQGILQIFEKHNCQLIATEVGQPFDMNLHEAVSMQPSEEHGSNTILFVASQGYQLHDRVIRPSQVIVSSGPAQAAQPQEAVERTPPPQSSGTGRQLPKPPPPPPKKRGNGA